MKKTYDLIIPIGSKCKCSFNLRRLHLQYESFPFDWIYIKNPDVVEKLLQTDFKDFLLEKNLRLRSKQPRFDEVDDLATGIYSAHDFDTGCTIHECYPAVRAKYDRRIAKLKNKIDAARRILLVHCAEDKIEELDAERQKQLKLVADLTANSVSDTQIDSITNYLNDWESVSFDDKRKVVDILISHIDATSESVAIHWKI